MKCFFTFPHLKILPVIFFLCCFKCTFSGIRFPQGQGDAPTDTFNIKNKSFLLPLPLATGKYQHTIGLLNVVLPPVWTLDVVKAPMFYYAGKYSLPKGFNLQASLATLFISNRINFGPFWNYSVNNYHFGAGYQVVYDYGVLKEFGFKTTITGWEQQPSLAAGYSFSTMAFILRGDLYWTNSLYITEGENTIPSTTGFLNGYSISANLEQRLTKKKIMSFGFKWNYLRYHFLAWPAFPVNQNHYGVPEFQIGLSL